MDDNQPVERPDKSVPNTDDETETFKTPDEAAAEDKLDTPEQSGGPGKSDSPESGASKSSNWKEKMTLHWPPGKKEWITFGVVVLLLIAGGIIWALTHKKPATLQPIPKVTTQKTVPSTLTGLPVDPIVNKRTVTGVMIENSIWARPQSGLGQAGVVFEAIAEGGITRFLALYQDTAPSNVGPIRSARPYFEQWNLGFQAGYAHVGGSPEALAAINRWHIRNLDQFFNPGFYHRISSREAPHNVYTSISTLNKLEVQKGYITSKYTGFIRKKKANPNRHKPISAKTINLELSGPAYNVHYGYNVKTNNYARSEGGTKHIEANTGRQIHPVVVIAMVVHYRLEADGYHSDYTVIGRGPVYIFQDGQVTKGTWAKKSNTAQITFTNAAGKPIKLNPGQTWLTAVAGTSMVRYAP